MRRHMPSDDVSRIECGLCGQRGYATKGGIFCECGLRDRQQRDRNRHAMTSAALAFADRRIYTDERKTR